MNTNIKSNKVFSGESYKKPKNEYKIHPFFAQTKQALKIPIPKSPKRLATNKKTYKSNTQIAMNHQFLPKPCIIASIQLWESHYIIPKTHHSHRPCQWPRCCGKICKIFPKQCCDICCQVQNISLFPTMSPHSLC